MATVLVVDDDADILEAVAEVLLAEGFAVQRAKGGAAALQLLRTGPPPAVVLLDARMDTVDGTAVSRAIRAQPSTCEVPIVFMTGDRRFRAPEGALVLEKPFALTELLGVLHDAVQTS